MDALRKTARRLGRPSDGSDRPTPAAPRSSESGASTSVFHPGLVAARSLRLPSSSHLSHTTVTASFPFRPCSPRSFLSCFVQPASRCNEPVSRTPVVAVAQERAITCMPSSLLSGT